MVSVSFYLYEQKTWQFTPENFDLSIFLQPRIYQMIKLIKSMSPGTLFLTQDWKHFVFLSIKGYAGHLQKMLQEREKGRKNYLQRAYEVH